MRKMAAVILSGLWGTGFCFDEYLPVEKGKFELDAGYSFTECYGRYDSTGTQEDSLGGSPASNTLPVQAKYGLFPGLDAEFAWTIYAFNQDAGGGVDRKGFGQPQLAVKYALPDLGAGAFVDLSLPFVTGNLDLPQEPGLAWTLGAVFGWEISRFKAAGLISYRINSENGRHYKAGNRFALLLKPEMLWTEFLGTYFGMKYEGWAKDKGKAADVPYDNEGDLLTLMPGLNVKLLKWLSYEINIPFTVSGTGGKRINPPVNYASWGLWGSVYMTFPWDKQIKQRDSSR